jgi:hypothetical protein
VPFPSFISSLGVPAREKMRLQESVFGFTERGDPSKVMQAIKQGFARQRLQRRAMRGRAACGTRLVTAGMSGKRVSMTLWCYGE